MTQLTNEERARIFGMYWNNDILVFNPDPKNKDRWITKFDEIDNMGGLLKEGYGVGWSMVQLLLTPISKITDEHAIEIAKIEGRADIKNITPFIRGLSFNSSIRGVYYEYGKDKIELFFNEYGFWKEIRHRDKFSCLHHNNTFNKSIEVVDRLRELGYALPYKGQSLFDLVIAIDRTNLKL